MLPWETSGPRTGSFWDLENEHLGERWRVGGTSGQCVCQGAYSHVGLKWGVSGAGCAREPQDLTAAVFLPLLSGCGVSSLPTFGQSSFTRTSFCVVKDYKKE